MFQPEPAVDEMFAIGSDRRAFTGGSVGPGTRGDREVGDFLEEIPKLSARRLDAFRLARCPNPCSVDWDTLGGGLAYESE